MIARRSVIAWTICIAVAIGVGVLIYDSLKPKLSRDEQWSLNTLDSFLRDLENPTSLNATARALACMEHESRAAQFRKLPVWRIERKVDRYLALCAQTGTVDSVERLKRALNPETTE